MALVSGGLAAGAEVVTAGVHVLTEGQKVTRYVEPAAAASGRRRGRPLSRSRDATAADRARRASTSRAGRSSTRR